jgi:hypothetical protein
VPPMPVTLKNIARLGAQPLLEYGDVREKTYMFGDNEGVIKSSTLPHSVLRKRHNMLSYHRVREAIAAGILCFIHMPGTENPADVLTKSLTHSKLWKLIKPFLFGFGDTLAKMDL